MCIDNLLSQVRMKHSKPYTNTTNNINPTLPNKSNTCTCNAVQLKLNCDNTITSKSKYLKNSRCVFVVNGLFGLNMHDGRLLITTQKHGLQPPPGWGVVAGVYVLKGKVKLGGVCIVLEVGQFLRSVRVVKQVELKFIDVKRFTKLSQYYLQKIS